MAQKLNYREIEMDVMERLYHERKETRQRAYAAKKMKSAKRSQSKHDPNVLNRTSKQSIYNMC